MAEGEPQRETAASAYREGHTGQTVGQGESPATPADPLVQRQSIGRAAGDRKPGQENSRSGRGNLGDTDAKRESSKRNETAWVSLSTAEAGVHPQEQRETAGFGYSDVAFTLHLIQSGWVFGL